MSDFDTRGWLVLLLIVQFSSCAPMTTQGRIRRDINAFQALSSQDQAAVQRGELRQGMSPQAVKFILGEPSEVFEGAIHRHETTRWNYVVLQADWNDSGLSMYDGPDFDSCHPGRLTHLAVIHRPKRIATALFVDGKLTSWERMR